MMNGVPRILIIRLSAIGDVVRVLPALHALRSAFPNAQIDWAVEAKSADIVKAYPLLDQCLVFERPEGRWAGATAFRQFCKGVRRNRYDIAVDFHGILKSGALSRASKAPKRYGFAPPRSRELSYLCANTRVKLHSPRLNRIDENLELCKALGANRHTQALTIPIPDDIQEEVDEYFDQTFDSGKRVVAIHAPVDRPEKQWPIAYFSELADMILADGRFEALLTWGPGQRPVVEAIRAKARRDPQIAPETPGLKHYARLVHRADIFFGGDTGPMHIAWAMGTPVVAVFGGTDPAKHAPLKPPFEVLYAGPKDPPKSIPLEKAQQNLRRISPEMAYDACVRIATR